MEIQVGEYVRTDNGLIGVVNKIELQGCGVRYAGELLSEEDIKSTVTKEQFKSVEYKIEEEK